MRGEFENRVRPGYLDFDQGVFRQTQEMNEAELSEGPRDRMQ